MNLHSLLSPLILLTFATFLHGQNRHTLSGIVQDASNGETLPGATISVKETGSGTVTNAYGFYSISLDEGEYSLTVSFIGYDLVEKHLDLKSSQTWDPELKTSADVLEEVIVTSESEDKNVRNAQTGVSSLKTSEISEVPVIFGERDVMKTIQLLPGIKSSEGGGGFFVRGGGPDQNLILLDEAPVYNSSHLLGFFSVFNSDAIKDLTVYKGHIPAKFGGRASSVLDIRMNDGNNKRYNVSGGIGLISSRLAVEGPIVKDRSSFLVTGRRTYADLFLKLSSDEDLRNSALYFYDLNAKANYRINEKNRIYLSGYFGRDNFSFSNIFGFDWGNTTATVRWNRVINDKLFLNSTLIYSDYDYDIRLAGDEGMDNGLTISSSIKNLSLKEDFDYFISPNNNLEFGLSAIRHNFLPGQLLPDRNSQFHEEILQEKSAWELAAYISEELSLSEVLELEAGLRYSWFAETGPGDFYTYDDDGEIIHTETYKKGEIVKTWHGLEPRFSLSYRLTPNQSVKTSIGRNRQYIHQLSNSSTGTPIDLWIPSSNNVAPQIGDQATLGYFRNFRDNQYESSLEVYYKKLSNQIDYKTGAEIVFNENVESQILFGRGRSYGAEFSFKKRSGRLTGWISYTLSRTERTFDQIDNGQRYPARWDRIHDLALVGVFRLHEKWTLSGNFVYHTGDAITYPVGKYEVDGRVYNLYSKRNRNRLPVYHRLDLSLTKHFKKKKNYESSLNISVYNVYSQKNAFIIDFRPDDRNSELTKSYRIALFGIIPSITYNFKFK